MGPQSHGPGAPLRGAEVPSPDSDAQPERLSMKQFLSATGVARKGDRTARASVVLPWLDPAVLSRGALANKPH